MIRKHCYTRWWLWWRRRRESASLRWWLVNVEKVNRRSTALETHSWAAIMFNLFRVETKALVRVFVGLCVAHGILWIKQRALQLALVTGHRFGSLCGAAWVEKFNWIKLYFSPFILSRTSVESSHSPVWASLPSRRSVTNEWKISLTLYTHRASRRSFMGRWRRWMVERETI